MLKISNKCPLLSLITINRIINSLLSDNGSLLNKIGTQKTRKCHNDFYSDLKKRVNSVFSTECIKKTLFKSEPKTCFFTKVVSKYSAFMSSNPSRFSGWTKRRCSNFAIPVDDWGRWRRFESRQRSWGNWNTSDVVTFERWTSWKIPGMKFYLSKILRFALLAILNLL